LSLIVTRHTPIPKVQTRDSKRVEPMFSSPFFKKPDFNLMLDFWESVLDYVVGVLRRGGHLRLTSSAVGYRYGVLDGREVLPFQVMSTIVKGKLGQVVGCDIKLYDNCENKLEKLKTRNGR